MSKTMNDNTIIIKDDDGNEVLMNILFTVDLEEANKKFVFFYEPENNEDVICMKYDDSGELYELDDEEFELAEEILETYNEDPKIQEIK